MTNTHGIDFSSLTRDQFTKSSFSGINDNCVHLAPVDGGVVFWESEHGFEPENMTFVPAGSFAAFRAGVQAGEFDNIC